MVYAMNSHQTVRPRKYTGEYCNKDTLARFKPGLSADRKAFWIQFYDRAKNRGMDTTKWTIEPTTEWITHQWVLGRMNFAYIRWRDRTSVDLYVYMRSTELMREIYDCLKAQRSAIDLELGCPLTWELRNKSARISHHIPSGGHSESIDAWRAAHDAMLDGMPRLIRALQPRLAAKLAEIRAQGLIP
jgi:hypothetical protein